MAVIKRTFNLNVKPKAGRPITALRAVIRHDNNRFLRKGGRKNGAGVINVLKTLRFASKKKTSHRQWGIM
jgi:hypothetical protein